MAEATRDKIINAAMHLIMEQGYEGTTTRQIAKAAGVNESTLFRRFGSKKEIVSAAMELPAWNPLIRKEDFSYKGALKKDLVSFAEIYMSRMTPELVKLSVGLQGVELEGEGFVPSQLAFREFLVMYFSEMQDRSKLEDVDPKAAAMTFLSMLAGMVYLQASCGEQLTSLSQEDYIKNSVKIFLKGIRAR